MESLNKHLMFLVNYSSLKIHSTFSQIMPTDFPKEDKYVYLQAISSAFTVYKKIPVSTVNGFLFIQTDKPLYTPEQEGQYEKNLSCVLEREFMYEEKDGASK